MGIVSFDEVRAAYIAAHGDWNGWELKNLARANQGHSFWERQAFPVAAIGSIILPYHLASACYPAIPSLGGEFAKTGLQETTLIREEGETVDEVARRLREDPSYQRNAPHCYSRIMLNLVRVAQGIGPVFLSDKCHHLGPTYKKLVEREGSLIHLDGTHRLLGLSLAEQKPDTIDAYIARKQ